MKTLKMGKENIGLPPCGEKKLERSSELETGFEEAELDRMTVDDMVIEHPNIPEEIVRRELGNIKEREKKKKPLRP